MATIEIAENVRYSGSIAELVGRPVVELVPCRCEKCHYTPAGDRSRYSAVVLDEYNERVRLDHVRPESVPAPAPRSMEVAGGIWFYQAGARPAFIPND
jgi:hypothetical protein